MTVLDAQRDFFSFGDAPNPRCHGGSSGEVTGLQVTVGRIGRAHGIRGAVVVGVRTDVPELRFVKGARMDTDPVGVGPLTVSAIKWHSNELLVRFVGIDDRNAAEELNGTWLFVDSLTIPPPDDPDEFNDSDLVGLSVRLADGATIGTVEDVLHPAQDLLVVKGTDGRELLIPFVKPIVPVVDIAAGYLEITPPEGLLNLEDLP
jgi:16S rRNA processing protein RimM